MLSVATEIIIILIYIFIIAIGGLFINIKYPGNSHKIKDKQCIQEINNAINNTTIGFFLSGIGGLIIGLITYLIVTLFTNITVRNKFGITILSVVLSSAMIYKMINSWKFRVLY